MTRAALLTIAGLLIAPVSWAQDIAGTWVSPVITMRGRTTGSRWIVNFSKDRGGELKGTVSGEALGHRLTSLVAISLTGSKLTFTFIAANGPMSFVGTLAGDGNSVAGWLLDQPLTLTREGHTPAESLVKTSDAPPPAAAIPPGPVPAAEPSALLSRALAKLAGTSQRLLRYSCTETIERAYYAEPAALTRTAHALSEAPVPSCDGKKFSLDGHLTLSLEDRLRLAVGVADNTQIQSWASASRFDSRPVIDLVPQGPISTAASGTLLVDVFENPGVTYRFAARKSEGARVVFEYAFDVPLAASHSRVIAGTQWKKTAYRGTFEIDAASAELVRLTSETDTLPLEAKMCGFRTDTGYGYTQIGDARFLLPGRSSYDTLNPDGSETRSVTTFSACHEYAAESSVSFAEVAPARTADTAPIIAAALPPGLSLTVALMEPLDLRTAAAGDAIAGKVTKAVRAPRSNAILVDAGAILHGRITQMQHRYTTSQFAFAIVYETLEQRDTVAPVAIEHDRELKAEQARPKNELARRGSEFSLPAPSAAGVQGSWFAVPAASGGYVVPAGYESKWVTVTK